MIQKQGNMWDIFNVTDNFCITANSYIKNNGELVMGKGIAYEMKCRHSDFPKLAGEAIRKNLWKIKQDREVYGLCKVPSTHIFLFQVKRGWWEEAELEIIKKSTEMLKLRALTFPEQFFDLNFPYAKLKKVFYVIETLPDTVRVWTK